VAKREGSRLMHASFELFRQDKQMIWLPVLGGIAASIGALIVAGAVSGGLAAAGAKGGAYVIALFLGLLVASFISVYFNLGVVFAANDRIEGRTPTIKSSLAQAWTRRAVIFRWAIFSSVVGVLVNALERRFGLIGRLVGVLGGFAWAVATYLVLPVLAFEEIGPIKAVERSAHLFKERFGAVVRTALRFGFLFLGWVLLGVALVVAGFIVALKVPAAGLALMVIGVFAMIIIAMVANTANLYMRTILYRFATDQPVPDLGVDLTAIFAKSR
jgi:hypothetical protein